MLIACVEILHDVTFTRHFFKRRYKYVPVRLASASLPQTLLKKNG